MDMELDVADPLHHLLRRWCLPCRDEFVDTLLQLAVLLEQLLDAAHQMLRLRLEHGSRFVHLLLELANELVGERSRDRLDAAHARGRPVSCVKRNSAIWPVAGTCVPPHSSSDTPGTSTTRTRSPYFSVKNAIAPAAIASLYFIWRVVTGRFSQMWVFTASSTRASVASSTGPWCAK